jgi:hypothetical protein
MTTTDTDNERLARITERLDRLEGGVSRLERGVSEIAGALHPGAVAGSLSPLAGGRERARGLRQIPSALEISDAQRGPAPLERRVEEVAVDA